MEMGLVSIWHWLNQLGRVLLILGIVFVCWGTASSDEVQYQFTDMAGREVALQGDARRIIPTFKPVTLCILAMGLQDRLVGIDTHSKHDALTRAVFPGVDALIGVGTKSTGINLETLVSLKPDLVILYAQKDGLALAKRLEKMKIPSMVILPETLDSIQRSMMLIAKAAGAPERAEKSIAAMDRVMALVAARTQGIPEAGKKRAYFASKINFFSTAAGNMLQDTMLSKAGMINVSNGLTGYFQNISPEQFMKWNPDIVFLSKGLKSRFGESLLSPVLQQVGAIQEKDLHRFPCNLAPWDFPSPLSALGTLWAGCRAYPHLFSDIDLMAEINKFHAELFGRTFTEMGGRLNDIIKIQNCTTKAADDA